jgi:acyl-coenzyme A synthetase/AMP-(fatty) acid ligase
MSRPAHVVDMVFYWAKAEPHRLALIQPEMVTSFQGLADAIESISDRIDRLGLDPSEPVGVSIANRSFMLATLFALFRCGFSAALVHPRLYPHLRSAGVRNLVHDDHGQVLSGGRNIRFDMSWLPSQHSDGAPARARYRHRPAGGGDLISFTSGTTGVPKPVRRPMSALSLRYSSPLNSGQNKVLLLPGLTGGIGFNTTCPVLYAGKTACFAPSAEAALALIEWFGVDAIIGSPQQVLALADIQAKSPRYDMSSLKTVRTGGAFLNKEAARRIKQSLCRNIVVWYSSSEAGVSASAPYDTIADVSGAVGFVLPEVELEIVDSDRRPMPVGSDGIVRLRTHEFIANCQAMGSDKHTPADDPWFYPGDIGRLTEDGLLCLAGRYSDVINRGGVKVAASRIEEVVEALPQIKEAAACGIEGASALEEIWIAVVPQSPIDPAEIKRHIKEHGGLGFEVDEVIEVQALPRNDAGKVQKHLLKETLLELKKGS